MSNQPQTPGSTQGGPAVVSTAPGLAVPPVGKGRIRQELIDERREKVKSFLDKGLTSPAKISRALGIDAEICRRDIKWINEQEKKKLAKKAAPDHVSLAVGQLDEIIKNCFADYMALKDNTSRAVSVRAQLMTTANRAVISKLELLQKTGVVPLDVTSVDAMMEAELTEEKAKGQFDPKLAQVVGSDESRRKVLDIIEKLKEAPPEAQAALLAALDTDQKVTAPSVKEEEPEPEAPVEPAKTEPQPKLPEATEKGRGGFGLPPDPETGS